jgi:hypothetical protein
VDNDSENRGGEMMSAFSLFVDQQPEKPVELRDSNPDLLHAMHDGFV